jgi:hypothetical protein
MGIRWLSVGFGVAAAISLGAGWTDSALAFSLNSSVTTQNFLRERGTLKIIPFSTDSGIQFERGPTNIVVGPGIELTKFGGIWDIDLSPASILFTLTQQPLFSNVSSGDDVYRFLALDFGRIGQDSVVDFDVFLSDGFSTEVTKKPFVTLRGGNQLDVTFPVGFAPGGLLPSSVEDRLFQTLKLRIDLTIEPTPIPTPALLPGLLGMGLAVLRKQRGDQH